MSVGPPYVAALVLNCYAVLLLRRLCKFLHFSYVILISVWLKWICVRRRTDFQYRPSYCVRQKRRFQKRLGWSARFYLPSSRICRSCVFPAVWRCIFQSFIFSRQLGRQRGAVLYRGFVYMSRFKRNPTSVRWTDKQTDWPTTTQGHSIYCVSMASRDKKLSKRPNTKLLT